MAEPEPPFAPPPRSSLGPPGSKAPWIIAVVIAIVIVVGIVLWGNRRSAPPPPPAPVAEPAAAPAPEAAPAPAAPGGPATLEDVSTNPLYRRGLEGDVRRRWAVVTDNLAEGVSPRKQLDFLAPTKPFSVQRRGDATVIAPEAYHRYDAFADAIASIDVPKLIAVYRTIHVELEHAYRALGYPEASLDAVSVRALRRIVSAPVPKGEVAVEETNRVYVFVDSKLEDLGPVEKHLVRMGTRNERIIQGKAREILQQLGPVRVEPAKPKG